MGLAMHKNPNLAKLVVVMAFAAAAVAAALLVRGAAAQSPTPTDDQVNQIAHQLYCPVCENTPLDVCPTEACRQWRDLIRQQLSQGWTEAQIKQYFVQQYGARVLATPPPTGINWLVYVLPPVVIVIGAYLLFRGMHSWMDLSRQKEAGPQASASEPPADEYVARLEEELRKRK